MGNHVSVISKPPSAAPGPGPSLDVKPPAPLPKPLPRAPAGPAQPPGPAGGAPSDRAPGPLLSAPQPRPEVNKPTIAEPAVLRQPTSLQPCAQPEPRGRTPTRQERSRLSAQNDAISSATGAPAAGGYNFQKIMDDRFEHYKRPASRERSTGPMGSRGGLSRDQSRDRAARAGSRQRTPMDSFSDIKASEGPGQATAAGGIEGLDLGTSLSVVGAGNGAAGGAGAADFKLPAEDQIRYRGVQQEIPHFGQPPKRTESLYMKAVDASAPQPTYKPLGATAIQRKKSLPDVATLPTVTVKQGSQAMTREEISVLSSARREEIRRQLDEAERYRENHSRM